MSHVGVAQGMMDHDDYDVIMTITSQAGNVDAVRFAVELQHMYLRYAERHHWQTMVRFTNEQSSVDETAITITVLGAGSYAHLKYEGGTHRVQRVPIDDLYGRIHTATVAVIVLPVIDEEGQQAALHARDWREKIRTYNFPQDRVTDHRSNLSIYDLSGVLDGAIDPFIDALRH